MLISFPDPLLIKLFLIVRVLDIKLTSKPRGGGGGVNIRGAYNRINILVST